MSDGWNRDEGWEFPCARGQKMKRVSSDLSTDRDSVEFSDVANRRMVHTSNNCRANDVYINLNNDYDC